MNQLLIISAIPLLITLLGFFPRMARRLPRLAAVLMAFQIAVVLSLIPEALNGNVPMWRGFAIDGTAAAFLVITTLVAAAAMIQAAFLMPAERAAEHPSSDGHLCMFYSMTGLFLLAMYTVLISVNIGYMWIAMEATTLLSAPLIYYHRGPRSLEATWKYLILCSVGIAFALFGTVLIFASQHGIHDGGSLLISKIIEHPGEIDQRLMRMGFIFCLLGYGTKAGIFPLHNWLPDAHSEAPSPTSAMLSGALLNCALVAIWRISQVVTATGQGHLVQQLLVPAGAITVLAASIMLIRQHDLKRMWAYSSVEHIGLLTLAIGINSGGVFMLHAFNHSLAKTALFLLSGAILHQYGTKSLSKLAGLLKASPAWGAALCIAGFAIAGSPPFGTFISEWLLLRDTFTKGEVFAGVVVIIGLAITFIAIMGHINKIVFGVKPTLAHPNINPAWAYAPLGLMAISLIAGFTVSPPVMNALTMLINGGLPR